jgi:hypothetical protein
MVDWLEILKKAVEKRGLDQVGRELGVSKTTISLTLSGKYGASTDNVRGLVERIYDPKGIECPAKEGLIAPNTCAGLRERAVKIGLRAGNPEVLRAYLTCQKCGLNRG